MEVVVPGRWSRPVVVIVHSLRLISDGLDNIVLIVDNIILVVDEVAICVAIVVLVVVPIDCARKKCMFNNFLGTDCPKAITCVTIVVISVVTGPVVVPLVIVVAVPVSCKKIGG